MSYTIMPYTTLDNLKALAKFQGTTGSWVSTADDALLTRTIASVSQKWDTETGLQWSHRTDAVEHSTIKNTVLLDRNGLATIITKYPIINSISLIEFQSVGDSSWQSVSDLTRVKVDIGSLTPGGCRIQVYSNTFDTKQYRNSLIMRLTADTGYSSVTVLPADVEDAVCQMALWFYKVPYKAAPDGIAASDLGPVKISTRLPSYIQDTIDNYKRQGVYR